MSRSLVFSILLALFGCMNGPSHDEVARVRSPDGKVDAVLIESNGGATTSFWYDVYLVSSGRKPSNDSVAYLYGAARNANAYGVNLKWQAADTLVIEYLSARDAKQTSSVVRRGEQDIQVVLRQGITDPKAPPGGMLYNQRGRPHDRS